MYVFYMLEGTMFGSLDSQPSERFVIFVMLSWAHWYNFTQCLKLPQTVVILKEPIYRLWGFLSSFQSHLSLWCICTKAIFSKSLFSLS